MDKKFQINHCSFFQVNDEIVECLYQEIIDIIKNIHARKVLDLYCGVGTIGISICPYVQEVIGVEVVKEAVAAADHNSFQSRRYYRKVTQRVRYGYSRSPKKWTRLKNKKSFNRIKTYSHSLYFL